MLKENCEFAFATLMSWSLNAEFIYIIFFKKERKQEEIEKEKWRKERK
jgi:hypothetical protein